MVFLNVYVYITIMCMNNGHVHERCNTFYSNSYIYIYMRVCLFVCVFVGVNSIQNLLFYSFVLGGSLGIQRMYSNYISSHVWFSRMATFIKVTQEILNINCRVAWFPLSWSRKMCLHGFILVLAVARKVVLFTVTVMGLLPVNKIEGCACDGNAENFFPATDFKGNR